MSSAKRRSTIACTNGSTGKSRFSSSGCLCCALRGDFVEGLPAAALASRRRRIVVSPHCGGDLGPRRSRADPARLVRRCDARGAIAARQCHDAGRCGQRPRYARPAWRGAPAGRARRPARSQQDRPRARRAVARAARAPRAFGGDLRRRRRSTPPPSLPRSRARRPATRPRAAHGAAEAHVFRSPAPIEAGSFRADSSRSCGELAGPRLLRVKGLVATADDPAAAVARPGRAARLRAAAATAGLAGGRARDVARRHRRGRFGSPRSGSGTR